MDREALDSCPHDELEDLVCQLHGMGNAVHRHLLAGVAAVERREAWADDGAPTMEAWLCYRFNLAPDTARRWLEVARALEELPAIAAAFAAGTLSWDQLVPLVKLATPETDAELAEDAVTWSSSQIRAAARKRRVATEAPAAAEERRAQRYVSLRHDLLEGFTYLSGKLTAEDGAVVEAAVERLAQRARRDDGEWEPFDARHADALVELAATVVAEDQQGARPEVVVHVDHDALVGGEGVAELENGAAVSADTARRLCCDATIRWVAHSEDGTPVGVGRASRNVPAWLRRLLRHRDKTCVFPGCNRLRLLDAHHLDHWVEGGPTDPDNLTLLCRYHHRLVHEAGWRVRGEPGVDLEFIRPDGKRVRAGPPPLRPEVRDHLLPPFN